MKTAWLPLLLAPASLAEAGPAETAVSPPPPVAEPALRGARWGAPRPGLFRTRRAAVDARLRHEIESGRTPSVQYLHFDADTVLHAFRAGAADVASGRAATAGTVYHAYSLTKVFTAVAVMRQVDAGRLSLDESVKHFLPDLPVPAGLTVRHLLSHTSGLANPLPLTWIHRPEEHEGFPRDAFFAPILADALSGGRDPGSDFRYSNLNYLLLGQILERVTGVGYERAVAEGVFSRLPLGSEALGFTRAPGRPAAVGYHARYSFSGLLLGWLLDGERFLGEPVGRWRPFREHHVNGSAYGGLMGTPGAFVAFGQALLRDDGGLVSAKSRNRMFRRQRLASGRPIGMGLGWFRGELKGRPYVCHAGGGGGTYCELRLYPEAQRGSFVVFNRSGFRDARFLDAVDGWMLEGPSEDGSAAEKEPLGLRMR